MGLMDVMNFYAWNYRRTSPLSTFKSLPIVTKNSILNVSSQTLERRDQFLNAINLADIPQFKKEAQPSHPAP
ncbi:hypothetical protein N9A94_06360 [Akkermansiaceae bacterium]|nr:hypothetical protein [Akkermansiaceae bacterium]